MRIIFSFLLLTSFLLSQAQSDKSAPSGIKTITSQHYFSDGSLEYKITSDYSKEGWLVKRQYESESDHWNSTTYFENNEDGYCTFNYTNDTLGLVTDSARYYYNSHNEITSQYRYYPQRGDVHNETFEYTLDSNNNVLESKQKYNGEPSWIYTHTYDDENNLILLSTAYQEEQRDEYVYTYEDGLKTNFTLFDYLEGYRKKNTSYDYTYSDEGLLLREDCSSYHYGKEQYVQSSTEYTYLYGLLDEETRYKAGEFNRRIVYAYVGW